MTALTIGLDFDNTIVDYQELFLRLANELEVFDSPFAGTRLALRTQLRARPGGEATWQRLQSLAYGPRIGDAVVHPGVDALLDRAHQTGARVVVVSHKTEFAAAAPNGANLRDAALGFMQQKGLLQTGRLSEERVHFAATRDQKLAKIDSLACDYFVDDLIEVLEAENFPKNTTPILFAPQGTNTTVQTASSWREVGELIFQ